MGRGGKRERFLGLPHPHRPSGVFFFHLTLIYPCSLFPLQTPDQALGPHLPLSIPICRPIGHLVLGGSPLAISCGLYMSMLLPYSLRPWRGGHHLQDHVIHFLGPSPRGTKPTISLALSLHRFSFLSPHSCCHFGAQHHQSLLPPPPLTLVSFLPLGVAMQGKPLLALMPIITKGTFKPGSTTHQLGSIIPPADLVLAEIVHSYPSIGGVWS